MAVTARADRRKNDACVEHPHPLANEIHRIVPLSPGVHHLHAVRPQDPSVEILARRPQVQERLTKEVADALELALEPRGVFVVIEAEHLCMTMRGVKKPGSVTVTSAVRGIFRRDARTRAEAFSLIGRDAG